jgi:hypothetical protein
MKLAIMQPYFFPYLGYFQLMNCVDIFVVYDNIEYTKKGWINRNRFLLRGQAEYFTIPLQKGSDYLQIRDRRIADDFDRVKFLNRIREAYRAAPYFDEAFFLLSRLVENQSKSLFDFLNFSLNELAKCLEISSRIIVSSEIPIDHSLKGASKVLEICRTLGASTYINAIGGLSLYSREAFANNGLELRFIEMLPRTYPQFRGEFVPNLSILDVMMFNSKDEIRSMLGQYRLI